LPVSGGKSDDHDGTKADWVALYDTEKSTGSSRRWRPLVGAHSVISMCKSLLVINGNKVVAENLINKQSQSANGELREVVEMKKIGGNRQAFEVPMPMGRNSCVRPPE